MSLKVSNRMTRTAIGCFIKRQRDPFARIPNEVKDKCAGLVVQSSTRMT